MDVGRVRCVHIQQLQAQLRDRSLPAKIQGNVLRCLDLSGFLDKIERLRFASDRQNGGQADGFPAHVGCQAAQRVRLGELQLDDQRVRGCGFDQRIRVPIEQAGDGANVQGRVADLDRLAVQVDVFFDQLAAFRVRPP